MKQRLRTLVFCTCAACSCLPFVQAQGHEPELPDVIIAARNGEVLFWDRMNDRQRSRLWSLLTHEQRLLQWRFMNRDQRRLMRQHMTPNERRAMKQRYVVEGVGGGPAGKEMRAVRKMTPAERELLRQQVIEVHVEIRRGVPYSCTDPTDCPRSAWRTRAAERRAANLKARTAPEVPAAAATAATAATMPAPVAGDLAPAAAGMGPSPLASPAPMAPN